MKNKAGHKSGSIMKKILVPLIILMIIQGCLFCGTILFGGTIEQLNYNAFEILNERVINRKNYIQNEMIQRWSNVEDTVAAVNSKVDNILSVHEVAPYDVDVNSDYSVEIISSIAEDVIYMLKKNSVTGAFVVLEGNDPQIKTGIYMRDLDPTTNASDNTDVLMERSPTDVFRDLGLAIDTNWQPNFDFNPDEPQERYAFYYKPFNAAQKYQHVNYQDLGYWSMPFKLSDGDIDVITYFQKHMWLRTGKTYKGYC